MRQVRIHGPGDARLDDVTDPTDELGPRDAVIEVAACGLCGTDVGYLELGGLAGPGPEPMALGHEVSGIVAAIGAEVEGLAVGTRVALDPTARGNMIGNGGPAGGLADRVLVRDAAAGRSLFEVPDTLPLDVAALAEPLGVGMHAVDQGEVQAGERVVVFGAGPIGMAAIATLVARGHREVVAVDLSDQRLELAAGLGASTVLHPERDDVWAALTDLHGDAPLMGAPCPGTDVYIEASGSARVLEQMIGRARRGARLVVVALHREPRPVSFLDVLMRELTIRGSMEYPDDFGAMVRMLDEVDLSDLITDRFGLDDIDRALALARSGESAGKILISRGGASGRAAGPAATARRDGPGRRTESR
jgi:threonine dehydrogenase-like Zn-dependent dehydrogenase